MPIFLWFSHPDVADSANPEGNLTDAFTLDWSRVLLTMMIAVLLMGIIFFFNDVKIVIVRWVGTLKLKIADGLRNVANCEQAMVDHTLDVPDSPLESRPTLPCLGAELLVLVCGRLRLQVVHAPGWRLASSNWRPRHLQSSSDPSGIAVGQDSSKP